MENDDGLTEPAIAAGQGCRTFKRDSPKSRYMYFVVDDSFKRTGVMDLKLELTYFDDAEGTFTVEFDGSDPSAPFSGAYMRSGNVIEMAGSKMWKNARFNLPQALLANSQNRGADLRLRSDTSRFFVRQLILRRE